MPETTFTAFTAYAVTGHTSDMPAGVLVEKSISTESDLILTEAVADTGELADDWGIDPNDEARLDTDAADAALARLGWQRGSDWVRSDGQWIAEVQPSWLCPHAAHPLERTWTGAAQPGQRAVCAVCGVRVEYAVRRDGGPMAGRGGWRHIKSAAGPVSGGAE